MIGILTFIYCVQIYPLNNKYATKKNKIANLSLDLIKRLKSENGSVLEADDCGEWHVVIDLWLEGEFDSIELSVGFIMSSATAVDSLNFSELIWFK